MNTQNINDNSSKDNKMRYQPIGKLLFVMSVPAIFSMLVQALYNIVDSLYVSKISESNNELTALNYAFPVQMICLAIALGIGVGTSSAISRYLGARKQNDADNAAKMGILLAVGSYVIVLICSFFVPKLFMLIYNDTEIIENLSIDYLEIVMAFSIGSFLEVVISKILQGTGNMIVPMLSQILGAITNIILDPIFIFEKGEFLNLPIGFGLGVEGAAIATVIAQCISGLFVILIILCKKQVVSFNFKKLEFKSYILKNIFSVGIAVAVMNSINALTTMTLNMILSSSGVTILGTYFKVQSFIFMPVFGLTQGALPIMGYNYGAREKERFFKALKLSLITSFAIMSVGLILFQTCSNLITEAFSLGELSSLANDAFRTISLCFIPAAICIIFSSMFQAIGHGYKSTLMSILRQVVCLIPLALVLKLILQSDSAVWWAYPISETLCLIIFSVVAYKTLKHLFDDNKNTINLDKEFS